MATKEIITISSDEESGCGNRSELVQIKSCSKSIKNVYKPNQTVVRSNGCTSILKKATNLNSSQLMQARIQKNFYEIYHKSMMKGEIKKDEVIIINEKSNKKHFNIGKVPEVVDLEDCSNVTETTVNSSDVKSNIRINAIQNHSEINLIESNDNDVVTAGQVLEMDQCGPSNTYVHPTISFKEVTEVNSSTVKKGEVSGDDDEPGIPEFFDKFVEFCSSLEKNKNDRARLIKKLQKRCNAADPKYVKSQEFRTLIDKSEEKINKNNLYLIAKEVTDELSLRKKIEMKNTENNEEDTNERGQVISEDEKKNKKKTKMINKIIKKLDKLGKKIRELEEAEVDLSDEEDSSYILVQRYRERFCQIYKKLCEVMNEPSDANRIFCRKICFSGTKYPAINQCIEKWLNKTKRFPDFNDIVKLLESQSSSLGLPSNKESIRATATEIFQEVGKMLQRRRKHDLWDSLCGFLNDDKDPALADPDLDRVLKKNFDTRIKKEQEIFRHYAELQEKERLEPEEVPEEEANLSPNESGNEDEEEIEGIEKSLNERLDVTIEKEHNLTENDYNLDGGEKNVAEEVVGSLPESNNPSMSVKEGETPTKVKESKNNYKNCKSIKYRAENRSKSIEDSSSGRNSSEETNEKDGGKDLNGDFEVTATEKKEDGNEMGTSIEGGIVFDKENSDIDIVSIESNEVKIENSDLNDFDFSRVPVVKVTRLPDNLDLSNIKVSGNVWMSPKSEKREFPLEDEAPESAKKRKRDCRDLEIDLKNDVEEVFEVHRCQIEHDYMDDRFDFLDDLTEKRKHWDKGKVFRDLTNVGRLMELNGRKRKSSGYFSHSIYHPGFPEFPKFSWKKRFRLNYKFVGLKDQKCALSQDDKESKSVGGDGKDSDGKGVENNSESGGDDGSNFFIGGGSGSEKDNDENDENKRSEKTKDFPEDGKHDEDEEDEEDDEDEMGGNNGTKPEEETHLENSFNCSTDDQMSSLNESNTTLELSFNRIAGIEEEEEEGEGEEETEESKIEDRSESEIITKSDGNGDSSGGIGADELEENIGDESMSPGNLEKNESEESYEESQEPEEDEVDTDKVKEYQTDGESNEMGKIDVEEKEEDAETGGEEDGKEDDFEIGDEQGGDELAEEMINEVPLAKLLAEAKAKFDDLGVTFSETQTKEDSVEISEEEGKGEDEETEGQQKTDVSVESTEEQKKEETAESGEVREKEKEWEKNEEKEAEVERSEGKEEDNRSKESIEQKEAESSSKKEKPLIRLRSLAEMEARIESRFDSRMVPRIEPRMDMRLDPRFGLRMEPRMEPRVIDPRIDTRMEPRVELRTGLGVEHRIEPRMEPRPGLRLEPRGGLRLEPRIGPRLEPRTGLRLEPRGGLRLEPRAGPRLEPRTGLRLEPRAGPRVELRPGLGIEQRIDPTRIEQRFERSPLGCKNKRENVVRREMAQANQVNPTNQTIHTFQPVQISQRKSSAREESSYHGNQDSEIEFLGQKIGKRKKTRSPTDEERVKKFLMHSPSSISIIPPKKLTLSKPPSQAALQALETLKGLKGISATRVRSKESRSEEEVVVIGESYSRPQTARKSTGGVKRRNELPVISSVHSIQTPPGAGSPKIQGFQGTVSGFQGPNQPTTTTTTVTAAAAAMAAAAAAAATAAASPTNNRVKNGSPGQPSNIDSSSIRISSVWGSMPQAAVYSRNMPTPGSSESPLPGCSFQKDSSSGGEGGGSAAKKKKKPVEFVVLE